MCGARVRNSCSLCLQAAELRARCKARGIHVTAYASLGSSQRPAKYQAATDPVLLEDPALLGVARRTGGSAAAVALAWALGHGVAVIPKSNHAERIQATTDNRRESDESTDGSQMRAQMGVR